ncbi:annulin-like [Arctopsyche grandis]|uniref:annulin-like n=1 Tax=Arctopsyche grandis TaxID=121162 RepID=UPI00406D9FB6
MGNKFSCFGKQNCSCGFFRRVWKPEQDASQGALPKPPNCTDTDGVATSSKVLTVQSIDYRITENGFTHHTHKFEVMKKEKDPSLVVRRGQSFLLDITFNRAYAPSSDAISFIFNVADAEKPNYGQGTLVAIPLLDTVEDNTSAWSAIVDKQYDNHLIVKVMTSPESIVAKWKIDVDTKLKANGAISYSHPIPFYLLFNPWCPLDSVFIEGEELREEYVLLDTGLIWRGSYNRLRPSIWKYAQYEKDILDCSLYLISEIGKVKGNSRGDPISISRAMSAAVNSPDDYGAVMGNWTDDFGGGTPPTKWVGSMEILQTYFKTKKPVKYGQCWVFAGVLTTICRAVGLPSRVVTTYASAHDTQNSLTVDYFVDEKGGVMEELNSDSIWNYHVWNEVWMQRPDLGSEYAGWQVIDATPQELSDNVFRCGPASVAAIKLGDVQKPYDNGFLFSEVNADKVYWRYAGPTQPLKLLRKDVVSVGKDISTKAVGKWEREDITENYKYPEKSLEERATMLKALRMSESLFSRYYLNEDFNDVRFDFALRDDIKIGQNFSVVVIVENHSTDKDHTVSGNLRVDTVLYTGKVAGAVKKSDFNKVIKPMSKEEIMMEVSFDEYYGRLVDQCAFNIACLATVVDTDFEYFAQDDFRVRKPDIKIAIHGKPTTGQEFEATIKLENPLPIAMKKCEFRIEGCGLEKQLVIKLKENVPPGGFATTTIKLVPPYSGRHTIAAKFVSKEMNDVDGFLAFIVQPKSSTNGNSSSTIENTEI